MLVSMANDNLNLFTQCFNGTILSEGTPGTPRLVGSGWPSEVSFTVKVQPWNWLSHIYCVLNWSFYIVTWSNLFTSTPELCMLWIVYGWEKKLSFMNSFCQNGADPIWPFILLDLRWCCICLCIYFFFYFSSEGFLHKCVVRLTLTFGMTQHLWSCYCLCFSHWGRQIDFHCRWPDTRWTWTIYTFHDSPRCWLVN